jgi:SWI/SNF-related matrix-associated actin-dependent regulator 1 of chromatin subfamily A
MTSPNPYQKVAIARPTKRSGQRIVPKLTWHKGWFIFKCATADYVLARQAGMTWYGGERRFWATKDWETAYRLKDYADDSCTMVLGPEFAKASARLYASRATDADIDVPAPEGLDYMPFQRAGIKFAQPLDGVLIGDEMGLGKTIQAIGLVNADPAIDKVLVICPASLKINWQREFDRWKARPLTVGIVSSSAYFPLGFNVTIVNYDILHRHAKAIRSVPWDMLIVDEAHYVKSATARRSRYVYGDASKDLAPIRARKRLFLTGTPIANRPMELWPLVHYLAPEVFKDERDYTRKYRFANVKNDAGRQALGALQAKLRMSCMVRRLKKDVLKDLPPKQRQVIEMPPGAAGAAIREEQQAMSEIVGDLVELRVRVELLKASDDEEAYRAAVAELKAKGDELFGQISTLRHKTALAKVPLVIDFVKDAVSDDHAVVLFAHHRDVLHAYHEAFKGSVLLYGGMDLRDRQRSIDAFQAGESQLFIGSLYAAGVGITLTKSSHVVFAELDWVPGTMTQAEDRCIAEGQPVLTPQGWRPIEEIKPGDLVITRSGRPRRVLDAWHRGAARLMTEVKIEGWPQPIVATSDHDFLLVDGEWRPAGNLLPGNRIAMPVPESRPDAAAAPFDEDCRLPDSFVGAGGRQSNGRLIKGPAAVALTDDALFTFGYYVGDGFASTARGKGRFVSFAGHQVKDRASHQRIVEWCQRQRLHVHERLSPGLGMEKRAFSGEWALWFAKNFGTGAANKRLPVWVSELSKGQSRCLLAGMMAADGYVRKGRREYVTISHDLAAQAAMLMLCCGLRPCLTRQSTGAYVVAFSEGLEPYGLVREVKTRFPRKPGGKRERVYDLTVEGEESFVVGLAVVHNCHRIGQVDSVQVQHLVLEGSLDALMAEKLVAKQQVIDAALDAETREEIGADPIVPELESPSTQGMTRAEVARQAERLQGWEAVQWVEAALDELLSSGGRMHSVDEAMAREIAALAERITPKQAVLGRRIARKYKDRLSEAVREAIG